MARLFPFRRGRRSSQSRNHSAAKGNLRYWQDENRVTVRGVARETVQWLGKLRPFILGAMLLTIWPALDPALVEPPHFLSTEPEPIDEQFTRCGPGRGYACVIDGDTFRLGTRKIRIIGIDAPEAKAQCPREARLAEQSTARLQELLNDGPFELVGRIDGMQDRYGRDLRVVRRRLPNGSYRSIGSAMREGGLGRRYLGGLRTGWC